MTDMVRSVREAIRQGNFATAGTGAFFLLNGLSPADLAQVLQRLGRGERRRLLAHIAEAAQGYDRPRLELALRTADSGRAPTAEAVDALDAVRNGLRDGDYSQTFTRLGQLQARQLGRVLGALDLDTVRDLEEHLGEASVPDQERLRGPLHNRRIQLLTEQVTGGIARGDFITAGTGAFFLLNGLNPTDLTQVLQRLGPGHRQQLLTHIAGAAQGYDRPRLEAALRLVCGGQHDAAASLSLLDSIRDAARTGTFREVFERLAGRSRNQINRLLRGLDPVSLQSLQAHLGEADAAEQERLRQIIADLSGPPAMAAQDVIDVQGMSGLNRTMAELYNTRGQYIAAEAAALGIPPHVAAGIMQAEAGGQTFGEHTDRPIARFEVHVFFREWGQSHRQVFDQHFRFNHGPKPWTGHQFRATPTGTWQGFHGDQTAEWRVIEFAAGLGGQEAAYRSASFGAGQTMGFNHALVGYASAIAMVQAYSESERAQIGGIFSFIRGSPGLLQAVQQGDYLTLATRYNGGGQAAAYAQNIRTYAAAYERVTRGRAHTAPP